MRATRSAVARPLDAAASAGMKDGVLKSFAVGGSGSMIGAASAHPFDLIKVRLQVQGEVGAATKATRGSRPAPKVLGIVTMAKHIWGTDGVKGFFSGVSASAMRQIVYSGVRFAAYDVLKARAAGDAGEASLSTLAKV